MTNETKRVLVGFYRVDGIEDRVTVDVPIEGTPTEQYESLNRKVRQLYPGKSFSRVGSVVESRSNNDPGHIPTTEGQTLRRLFPDVVKDAAQDVIQIGSVFYDGAPHLLYLQYDRGRNTVSPILKPRLAGRPVRPGIRFSGGHLVTELSTLLTNGFGRDARNLVLKIVPPTK